MFGKGLLKGLGITLGHVFEKDITVQYPEERPFLQDRYRGCLAFDFPKCIVCGLCIKTCPNNVLSFETAKEEGSKKKKLLSYTIDLQYCLFCNLCVEVCPTNTLYFNKDFELTKFNRDDIKIVYNRPAEMDSVVRGREGDAPEEKTDNPETEAEAKRLKQVEAMKTVLAKNPQKSLAKIFESEEDIAIMANLMSSDDKKLNKMAELMVEDKEKAAKLAQAWVNKDKKDRPKEGGEQE